MSYQPKTGSPCSCRRGAERDNCPRCEGTGMQIDFAAIRAKTVTPFISIPVRSMTLDPQNKEQVRKLVEMAEAKFKLSAKAWIDGNNSGDSLMLAAATKRENRLAQEGAALLEPLGIKCDWPGLYPSFTVKGHSEHSTEMAVLAALGHPRNWLRIEEAGK